MNPDLEKVPSIIGFITLIFIIFGRNLEELGRDDVLLLKLGLRI